MSGATFGRKGMAGGSVAPPQPAGFGRVGRPAPEAHAPDPMAERRAAFLAEERTRKAQGAQDAEGDALPGRAAHRAVYFKGKSLGTAYVLWFFLGGFSAHRFYLGHPLSGVAQVGLVMLGWALFLGLQFGAATLAFGAGGLWILADAFIIPSLARDTNRRLEQAATAHAFA